jgi:U3 small nucleolar RNA-associated protein 19
MPAVDDNTGRVAKRKRPQSEKGPLKRVRPESGEEDAQARILLLENEVFESKRNYNNIPILIKIVKADTEEIDDAIVAAISLCRIFSRFMVSGDLEKTKNSSEKDVVVIRWLWGKYSEYKTALLVLLGEESVASTILTLCMRLLKSEGQYLRHGEDYNFPSDFLVEIVQVLLSPGCDRNVRREFSENFVEEYDDIRFYTFEAIECVYCPFQRSRFASITNYMTVKFLKMGPMHRMALYSTML